MLLLGTALLSACTTPVAEEEEVEKSGSELALYAIGTPTWKENNYVVNICYVDAGFAQEKAWMKDALNSSWGASSGLSFTYTDVCPHDVNGFVAKMYLPIHLYPENVRNEFGGTCQPGYGGRQLRADCGGTVDCQCRFSTSNLETDPKMYFELFAIHEVGHGLGMLHEHQRSDRPANPNDWCVDRRPNPGDWNTDGSFVAFPDNQVIFLTDVDATLSVMSYCRDWDGNGQMDLPPVSLELSPLDKLGIEILYPRDYTRKPVVTGGFANADSSQVVVRGDTPTQFTVDWIARGAKPGVFKNVVWSRPGDPPIGEGNWGAVLSTEVSPSLTIVQQTTVQLNATDLMGRAHAGGQIVVVPDNALHTAIAMNALMAL